MLNIEVARDSKVIALASSRDSTAMKTVALLTITFLPGTFVAVSRPISLSNLVPGMFLMIPRPWCGISYYNSSANHMLVIVRNAPI